MVLCNFILREELIMVPNVDDPVALLKAIFDALNAHNWLLAVPLACLVAVFAARKYGGKFWPFLTTDRGGALLSLVTAAVVAFAGAVLAPGPHGALQLVVATVTVLLGNQLLFSWLNKLLSPSGEDKAQAIAANAAATEAKANECASAAANAINGALPKP